MVNDIYKNETLIHTIKVYIEILKSFIQNFLTCYQKEIVLPKQFNER